MVGHWRGFLLAGAASSIWSSAAAQAPARLDCSAAQYRQLDFWVGDWIVFNTADNAQYATSRIERIVNGCAVRESYDSPKAPGGPYSGTSITSFDRKDGKWHQMYVDVNGSVTWFSGGLEGADMVLTAPGAASSTQRMVYRPQADGSVRQIGSVSSDGGNNWKPGYDYTYRRK